MSDHDEAAAANARLRRIEGRTDGFWIEVVRQAKVWRFRLRNGAYRRLSRHASVERAEAVAKKLIEIAVDPPRKSP